MVISPMNVLTTGPWFDHEDKLPNRPLFRHPEALALTTTHSVSRPVVEGLIMLRMFFRVR
jgi:hypothetical protein